MILPYNALLSLVLAVEICDSETGMDDPQKIPDVTTPEGSDGSPVDEDSPLTIPPNTPGPIETVVDLGGSPKFPDDTPFVEKLVPDDEEIDNVESVRVYYQEDDSGPWIEVTDGVRDVPELTNNSLTIDL